MKLLLTCTLMLLLTPANAQTRAQLLERQLDGNPKYIVIKPREADPNLVMILDRTTYQERYWPEIESTVATVQYEGVVFDKQQSATRYLGLDIKACKDSTTGKIATGMYNRTTVSAKDVLEFDLSKTDLDWQLTNDLKNAVCEIKRYHDNLVNVRVTP